MNILERHLLSLLDTLRWDPAADNALAVCKNVVVLKDMADALDLADPQQYAVRELYDYLDAASRTAASRTAVSRTAVSNEAVYPHRTGLDIESVLCMMLAASRQDYSVFALAGVRDDLQGLAPLIDDLKPEEREPLHRLLSYVGATNRQALELALRRDRGKPGHAGSIGIRSPGSQKRPA
jgi:hypothetical protein